MLVEAVSVYAYIYEVSGVLNTETGLTTVRKVSREPASDIFTLIIRQVLAMSF